MDWSWLSSSIQLLEETDLLAFDEDLDAVQWEDTHLQLGEVARARVPSERCQNERSCGACPGLERHSTTRPMWPLLVFLTLSEE